VVPNHFGSQTKHALHEDKSSESVLTNCSRASTIRRRFLAFHLHTIRCSVCHIHLVCRTPKNAKHLGLCILSLSLSRKQSILLFVRFASHFIIPTAFCGRSHSPNKRCIHYPFKSKSFDSVAATATVSLLRQAPQSKHFRPYSIFMHTFRMCSVNSQAKAPLFMHLNEKRIRSPFPPFKRCPDLHQTLARGNHIVSLSFVSFRFNLLSRDLFTPDRRLLRARPNQRLKTQIS
jgi:hypothetical protein